MQHLRFRCSLLTDIILNQKAATEGSQESLDFIPGSNFLGILASKIYGKENPALCQKLFHSGRVRFGDAHPEKDKCRCLRVPASMYRAKLESKGKTAILIHHLIQNFSDWQEFQPKQYRTGFYNLEGDKSGNVEPLEKFRARVDKNFAIKSAYDRDNRRAADSQMYGYESLEKDSTWLFDISIDDGICTDNCDLITLITNNISGHQRIGRSRSAQYGLVNIEHVESIEPASLKEACQITKDSNYAIVYADARLIFFDKYDQPTFQPTAEDLGFTGGELDWEHSQVRHFQYAPWNFKRQARDTDRCGIEKGSVFYIKKKNGSALIYAENQWVGKYQNEGFGAVIINPSFLEGDKDGVSSQFNNAKETPSCSNESPKKATIKLDEYNAILSYLIAQRKNELDEFKIYELVNGFVTTYKTIFSGETFASQWGSIRKIALGNFDPKGDIEKYISQGVAKQKWEVKGRNTILTEFMTKITNGEEKLPLQKIMINLASQMAKVSNSQTQKTHNE